MIIPIFLNIHVIVIWIKKLGNSGKHVEIYWNGNTNFSKPFSTDIWAEGNTYRSLSSSLNASSMLETLDELDRHIYACPVSSLETLLYFKEMSLNSSCTVPIAFVAETLSIPVSLNILNEGLRNKPFVDGKENWLEGNSIWTFTRAVGPWFPHVLRKLFEAGIEPLWRKWHTAELWKFNHMIAGRNSETFVYRNPVGDQVSLNVLSIRDGVATAFLLFIGCVVVDSLLLIFELAQFHTFNAFSFNSCRSYCYSNRIRLLQKVWRRLFVSNRTEILDLRLARV